ncbi:MULTISPECIES: hypothetical protein [unclassified Micromonospora]|uniref:hypothetical protein n=1 Tax=unclassified Micromonospora TaxID=2617518 RepID=UPI0022B677F3|nr:MULTISPECIES: hypothetical protein [unclassified Micromonospora]MCZ7421881.1 hypothetical protein [Verrucosispora sp. WMMA2121]WBB93461.1 hypothetical protein O7597_11025 [Verrucosispora sp. WMMC514]
MAGVWRDFITAVIDAVRRRDEAALNDERRRALDRLADEKIREEQRKRPPEST